MIIALISLLFSCAPGSKRPETDDSTAKSVDDIISDAVSTEKSSDDTSAEYYILQAKKSTGDEKIALLLKAAEKLLARGDIDSAQDYLHSLKATEGSQIKTQFLAARIALANNDPKQAIELLPDIDTLAIEQKFVAIQIKASAKQMLGQTMSAVNDLIAIDAEIISPEEKNKNHQLILTNLLSLPSVTLSNLKSEDRVTAGWIDLALVLQQSLTHVSQLQDKILDWGTRYTNHPVSNAFINNIIDKYTNNVTLSDTVAILLPSKGPYETTTNAIKNGILSAYYRDSDNSNRPKILFYDTSDESTDFNTLYHKAILDGANFVIGPINKETVGTLSLSNNLTTPVLSLNYSEDKTSVNPNLFQFGLLPEDEARQAAELAISNNLLRAAVYVPESLWGERLYQAFTTHFEELGGKVMAVEPYSTNTDDYSRSIKRLLNINHSYSRKKDIEHILGTSVSFEPNRRQDIDMIFMGAIYRAARGIMPSFKFHHAGDVPVYATSHVYSGSVDRTLDRDLEGLVFCDMPWTLVKDDTNKMSFKKYWPGLSDYTRLFALGIDAYHLLKNINYLKKEPTARYPGETGTLSIDKNNRLHRELVWAKFKAGRPVFIDTTNLLDKTSTIAINEPGKSH